MPRHRTFKRIEADGLARFITFTCYQRLPLLNSPALRDHFVRAFAAAIGRSPGVRPLAWVVMPDHVHLILQPEAPGQITAFLTGLKATFAKDVLARWREKQAAVLPRLLRSNGTHRYWQTGGGFDRLLHGQELFEKIAYCHRNPIKRGLAERSIDWPWSSARQYERLDDPLGPRVDFEGIPPTDRPLT